MATGKNSARAVALRVLNDVSVNGAYSNLSLNRNLHESKIGLREKNLAVTMVYGVLKMRLTLDFIIGKFTKSPIAKMPPIILNILRMGVYQIFYLDRVPDSAACNESVELTVVYGFGNLKGFVNGVLRNIIRERSTIAFPDLSVKYSYPMWMVERFAGEFGAEEAEKFMAAQNLPPEICIRVNTTRISRDELAARLLEKGVTSRKGSISEFALLVDPPFDAARSVEFAEGLFHIQDESAIRAAEILAPEPGETVADVCAAPGGKSFCLAELMKDEGTVFSCDIFPHKIELIREQALRLGLKCIRPMLRDATVIHPELKSETESSADRVMIDAPCSGFGVIGRRPEIKWNRKPEDVQSLAVLQASIIRASAPILKPGGTMVYCTCTTGREENEDIVDGFLREYPEFTLEAVVKFLPHLTGSDGFFIAKMKRGSKK